MKKSSQKIDLTEYEGLVIHIASRYAKKSYAKNDYMPELISAGWDGVMDAHEKYNSDIGLFSTYASHRIEGSILDKLRSLDRYPRQTRQWVNKIEKATSTIESRNMESAKDYEIANELRITLDRYNKILFRIYNSTCFSLDEYLDFKNNDAPKAKTFHETHFIHDPSLDDEIYKKEVRLILSGTIRKSLTEREQLIIDLYYYEEKTMLEIGHILGLVESRICQIHKEILKKLTMRLNPG